MTAPGTRRMICLVLLAAVLVTNVSAAETVFTPPASWNIKKGSVAPLAVADLASEEAGVGSSTGVPSGSLVFQPNAQRHNSDWYIDQVTGAGALDTLRLVLVYRTSPSSNNIAWKFRVRDQVGNRWRTFGTSKAVQDGVWTRAELSLRSAWGPASNFIAADNRVRLNVFAKTPLAPLELDYLSLVRVSTAECSSNADCDDGNACRINTCSAQGVCESSLDTSDPSCCGSTDDCPAASACMITTCTDNQCGQEVDPSADPDCCVSVSDCEDGNACRSHSCSAQGVCEFTVDTQDPACCYYNVDCPQPPPCMISVCMDNQCDEIDNPDAGSRCCASANDCDDGDVCTRDECIGETCIFTPDANQGSTCCAQDSDCADDGDACTIEQCDTVSNTCATTPSQDPECTQDCTNPGECFQLGLRVLVITAVADRDLYPGWRVILDSLEGYGIPYDLLDKSTGAPLELVDAQGRAKYNGIALSSGGLASQAWNNEDPGTFASALSASEWTALHDYAKTYNVRIFSMSSNPGVCQPGVSKTVSYTGDTIAFVSSPSYQPPGVAVATASWDLPSGGIRSFHASFTVGSSVVQPLMQFSDGTPAAAVCQLNDREEMHFFFENAFWTEFSQALSSTWVDWLVQGLYVGERRSLLLCQVDDYFLSTELWDVAARGRGTVPWRSAGPELAWHSDWQDSVNARLPAGSTFKLSHAYNGNGVYEEGGPASSTTFQTSQPWFDAFYWLSHTFTHPFLDGMSYQAVRQEMQDNFGVAAMMFPTVAKRSAAHSEVSMVPPSISGQFDGTVLSALWDSGIRSTVGDNSRAELLPTTYGASAYHMITTTVSVNGFAGMNIIPRWATWIAFDASTPEENMSEYHAINGPNCNLPGCTNYETSTFSIDELWRRQSKFYLPYLLAYRHDPYMFHQANLRVFQHAASNTGEASLISGWVDQLLDDYLQFSTLPVWTLRQDHLADMYRRRMAVDASDLQAWADVQHGSVMRITLAASTDLTVSLTGVSAVGVTPEVYGPDVTSRVDVSANLPRDVFPSQPVAWQADRVSSLDQPPAAGVPVIALISGLAAAVAVTAVIVVALGAVVRFRNRHRASAA